MATVPLSGTNIRLLSGVPFNNDYKNTRWFDTLSEQTNYFLSKPVIYRNSEHSFQRIEGQHFIKVFKSIDELWGTNYLMFQNSHYNSKWFYAFVTKLEYVNHSVTYVHFQIDVFQTWKFEMNFKPSYVVREHCKLWNTDGTPVINTVDEGLDYGLEYETVYSEQFEFNMGYKFLVIVSKAQLHNANNEIKGSVVGTPQPLSYYVIPFKEDGTTPDVSISSLSEPAPVTVPITVFSELYKSEIAVNNIVSFYVTEYTGLSTSYRKGSSGGSDIITFANNEHELEYVNIPDTPVHLIYVKKVKSFDTLSIPLDTTKYEGFKQVKESKLLMYPYCVTVLDDFKSNRIQYRNEHIQDNNLMLSMKGSLGLSNKMSYGLKNYNHNDEELGDKLDNEFALINQNPQDIPIINDLLTAFLQGNKNAVENQKSAIMFNGTIGALTGGMVGGAQSTFFTKGGGTFANPIGVAAAGLQTVTGVGNAIIEMQGIQSKQKDIGNQPPEISKMGSNTAYDFGNDFEGIFLIKKQIKPEYRKKLSDFFNMFGYKLNEVKIPNFHTRRYWNYVQTINCNIIANINNDDLTDLKKVFDNGITFWHTDDVGNYALDNEVIR